MKSSQNLSPGTFRHAEAESEVKHLRISQPDLEIKENDVQILFYPFVGLRLLETVFSLPFVFSSELKVPSVQKDRGDNFFSFRRITVSSAWRGVEKTSRFCVDTPLDVKITLGYRRNSQLCNSTCTYKF